MDPDKALARILELSEFLTYAEFDEIEHELSFSSAAELAETISDLHDWIRQGGFLPTAWQRKGGGVRNEKLPILDEDGTPLKDAPP